MRTRPFGTTGVQVSVIGLGGMPLSIQGRPSREEGVHVIHAALDAGMTFIDTADVYCRDDGDIGHNEQLIAQALRDWPRGNEVLVATKGGLERPEGAWTCNGRPEHLRKACEASLEALGVDTIAVYQLHAPDDQVPFADSMGQLARLREEGKIRWVGLSNVTTDEIRTAQAIVPVVSVQNRCNPLDRRAYFDGVLQLCEEQGLAFLPYSPVGGGRDKGSVGTHPVLAEVGRACDATAYEVALAWLLASSPAMLPIPGASRESSARSSARAGSLELAPEHLRRLVQVFPTGSRP